MPALAVILCLALVALGVLYMYGSSKFGKLVEAGAKFLPVDSTAAPTEVVPLAMIGNHQYENLIAVQLRDDGILVGHKVFKRTVFLPAELLQTTGNEWAYPIEFGRGPKKVGLNFGLCITSEAVNRLKAAQATANNVRETQTK